MENREKLQDLHKQALMAMSDVNDIEKTVSRLRNELREIEIEIIDSLDGE